MVNLWVMSVLAFFLLQRYPREAAVRLSENARHEGRALRVYNKFNSPSGVRQIGGRLLAALGHDFIGEALTLVERAHAGALDRADVHEHIFRAIARRDGSETFLRVEELNGTCGHRGYLCVIRCWR